MKKKLFSYFQNQAKHSFRQLPIPNSYQPCYSPKGFFEYQNFMNHAPAFDEPLATLESNKFSPSIWQKVVQSYENGKYKESFLGLFQYINPNIIREKANDDMSEFILPHGSAVLYVTIKNDHYSIKAPFLKVTQKNIVPLLRQVAEINFAPLTMSQIVLRNNELHFEHEGALELCEPNKIYSVMEEICVTMDLYDDIFIEKFGTESLKVKVVKPFSNEEKAKAWEKYQTYLDEALSYSEYFESKRLYGYAWDMINMGLMKIDYYMAPQGFLASEIKKYLTEHNKRTLPLTDIIAKGKNALQRLKNYPREKFDDCLYRPDYIISPKKKCDLTQIHTLLGPAFEQAKNEIAEANFMGSSLSLLSAIYNVCYRYSPPSFIMDILQEGLKKANGKTWKETSQILFESMGTMMGV